MWWLLLSTVSRSKCNVERCFTGGEGKSENSKKKKKKRSKDEKQQKPTFNARDRLLRVPVV